MDIENLLKLLNEHEVRYVVIGASALPVHGFEEVWQTRVKSQYGETPAFFAGLDALIEMKKAANRPKDQEDLKYLQALKKRKMKK